MLVHTLYIPKNIKCQKIFNINFMVDYLKNN